MKIMFANPPFVKYKNRNPKDDWHVCLADYMLTRKQKFFRKLLWRIGFNHGMRYGVRAGSRWPWTMPVPHGGPPYPFFMGYAASLLLSKGFDVHIIDYIARNDISYSRFLSEVKSAQADIVVLECSTPTVDIDVWVAEEISNFSQVALAGPHITANAAQMHNDFPFVSYWLKGEYLLNSLEMAQTCRKGIYEPDVVKDIDSIPFPFRDYREATLYFDPTMPTEKPQLQIYGSKGCPFKCSFCLWPQTMYNGQVSLRKPEKIAEEINEAVSRHGYKSIFFDDDTFNIGNERVSKICDELKKIGLPWTMMGRLDCSPDWLYDKMVDCGCVGMRFGVETFNHNVLAGIQKGIERIDFRRTLEYLSNKYPELMIHLTMMRDMPEQTDEIHYEDMSILKSMGYSTKDKFRNYQLSSCAPFPGTKMYQDLEGKKGREFLLDFSKYDGGQDTLMKNIGNKIK